MSGRQMVYVIDGTKTDTFKIKGKEVIGLILLWSPQNCSVRSLGKRMVSCMPCPTCPTIIQNSVLQIFNRCSWSSWTVVNPFWPKGLFLPQFSIWVYAGLCVCVFRATDVKVDPGVLAHLKNFPAECQVKFDIFEDPSLQPTFSWLSRQLTEMFHPDLLCHDSPLHLGQMTSPSGFSPHGTVLLYAHPTLRTNV